MFVYDNLPPFINNQHKLRYKIDKPSGVVGFEEGKTLPLFHRDREAFPVDHQLK